MNSAIEQRKGRTLVGTVISDKCDKTIVVRVETLVQHPLLKKYVRRRKKCTAHDPNNECGIVEKEMPIHVSNLMVVCSACGKPTRVGYRYTEDGKKIRFCKKCNETL